LEDLHGPFNLHTQNIIIFALDLAVEEICKVEEVDCNPGKSNWQKVAAPCF
jgi:hypothetical protein